MQGQNVVGAGKRLLQLRRPKRVFIVRHGQSLGNVDESAYVRIPDWCIPLTDKGVGQAQRAGEAIRRVIGDEPIYTYVSPYRRCRETLAHMFDGPLGENTLTGSVREEPRLIEQQFGNFQDLEEIQTAKRDRRRFGRFFYRFPNGESGLDVYNRVTSFIGTLHRDWQQEHFQRKDVNTILVTHGLAARLFIMRWFQYSVQEFEDSYNPPNCGVCCMHLRTSPCGSYSWYELDNSTLDLLRLPPPLAGSGPRDDGTGLAKESVPQLLQCNLPHGGGDYDQTVE
eukprot:Hpha_TRINITY_DN5183_c0_g1::TRINITY_DN5183_c0_g1_i1::g.193014::m.193014